MLALRTSNYSAGPCPADIDFLFLPINVPRLQPETLRDSQSSRRNQERKCALQLRHELQYLKGVFRRDDNRLVVAAGRLAHEPERIGFLGSRNQPIPLPVFVHQEHLTAILVQGGILQLFLIHKRVQPSFDFQRLNAQRVLLAKPRARARLGPERNRLCRSSRKTKSEAIILIS